MRLLTLATLMSLSAGAVALAQTSSPSPATSTSSAPAASTTGASAGTSAQDPSKPAAKPSSDDATIAAEHSANADADKIIDPKADSAKTDDKSAKKSKESKDGKATDVADSKKDDDLPSPGDHLDPHIKKGSEEDVNAIGTRNIGGRGMGNWYTTNGEIGMGKQYSMEVEKSSHLVTDPVVVEYVNRVGQNLVKNSDAKVPFTIKVLDTDEINAMALPGGFFYVNSGLILACDSEDELAGVMAHEISHVVAHHAAREMTRMNYMQIASVPLMIFTQGTWTGYGIYEAAQLAVPMAFLQFSRNFEAEADFLGVQWMYKAGYDPQGMVTIFEKLSALEKHKPGALSKAFSDHPATPDRIANVEDEIATILPARPEYLVTTSEFDQVKARLARIQNKRGLNDKKNGNKPTLRRTASTNNDPNSTTNSNDGPPTLGRRN